MVKLPEMLPIRLLQRRLILLGERSQQILCSRIGQMCTVLSHEDAAQRMRILQRFFIHILSEFPVFLYPFFPQFLLPDIIRPFPVQIIQTVPQIHIRVFDGIRRGDLLSDKRSDLVHFPEIPGGNLRYDPSLQLAQPLLCNIHRKGLLKHLMLAFENLFRQSVIALCQRGQMRQLILILRHIPQRIIVNLAHPWIRR